MRNYEKLAGATFEQYSDNDAYRIKNGMVQYLAEFHTTERPTEIKIPTLTPLW
jgi:hypothetical protein